MSKNINVPKLRFSEFSGEWEEKRLRDIGTFKNGLNKSKEDFGFGHPFVNLMDVFGKDVVFNENFDLVNANEKDLQLYNLLQGDILFIRSSVKREGVGETVLILDDLENTTYSGFLIRFREKKDILNLLYKKYCFKTKNFRNNLLALSTTSANTNINQESLNTLEINIPSKPEQEKIATFLTSVDTKIEQLTKKEVLLQQYKKGVMGKLFNGEIRFKAEDGSNFPEWEEYSLKDFLVPTLREVEKPKENYLAIGVRSHCKGTFQKPDSEPDKIAMDKLYVVNENDLIVNITFAWESAIAIVKKEDEGGLVSHRFPTYTFDEKISNSKYFQYVIIQKRFRIMLDLISPGGAGRNRVMSKKDFLTLKWELPCIKEQTKIANFLSSIDDKIEQVQKQLDSTKEFKKALLQQMFV
jgi:type I restriction enzyme S subunit